MVSKQSSIIFFCLCLLVSPWPQLKAKESIAPAKPIIISAAHPDAVEAGIEVLRRGGDASDAAVAIQAMLGLVEPQSSGLGGGAFMLRYDAKSKQVEVYDGRETAPASSSPTMFLGENKSPISRREAMVSGKATGIPGVVAMLYLAQSEHGKLPWSSLFETTARKAHNGFVVSPRLGRFVRGPFPQNETTDVHKYFTKPNGQLIETGDVHKNPDYADTVRQIARNGPNAFYRGEIANTIIQKVNQPPLGAVILQNEIANYRALKRKPLCIDYAELILCTAPPPSSGVSLLQLLLLLKESQIAQLGPNSSLSWFLFAEASRLMYADRDAWVGDPAFVNVPITGLLDKGYIKARLALIGQNANLEIRAGSPEQMPRPVADKTVETGGTSHFVISDQYGNIVSMTTTIESFFGSGRMVHGFFLNNQMTDFSLIPEGPNAIAPGKRPRSSMSPVIVLDKNMDPVGAIGSPGGSAIIAYIAKVIIGAIDWKLKMQDAIDLPNLVARGNQYNGEANQMSPSIISDLAQRGVNIRAGSGEDSGLHGFIWSGSVWDGGADRRRDGIVRIEEKANSHSLQKQ